MRSVLVSAAAAAALCGPVAPDASAAVTSDQVRRSIRLGMNYLRARQMANGQWDTGHYSRGQTVGGPTALAALAMLSCGAAPDDPVVAKALQFLRGVRSESTYVVGLQAMVFANAEPRRDMLLLTQLVGWLVRKQIRRGSRAGMWHYGTHGSGDNSNTQYALLGLREAAAAGIRVPDTVWRRSRRHWLGSQNRDGSWGYGGRGADRTGSMSVAGLASLLICGSSVQTTMEKILPGGRFVNCGQYAQEEPVTRALAWLARNFSVRNNPGRSGWYYYYMYGLERAGRLSGKRFFGVHDWYREGAAVLLDRQQPDGSWPRGSAHSPELSTAFALLFLAKGRWPVLVNKVRWPSQTAVDRNDVANLVAEVGRVWSMPLTWQLVNLERADVRDLLVGPMLCFNGPTTPEFTDAQIAKLREYVIQGGFILADARCSRRDFDAGFRRLVKRLFPEPQLKLRRLQADHPIWRAEYNLDPSYPLEGLNVGCRTSIVYSPRDLSCHWGQGKNAQTTLAFRVGVNICAYATGKENLLDKLETRLVVDLKQRDKIARDAVQVAKLRHGGGWNVAMLAVPNLMGWLRKEANLDVVIQAREVAPQDPQLRRYPLAYMEGRSRFGFLPDDRKALAEYLQLGGFLMANAVCGSEGFDQSFRELMGQIFPNEKLEPLPADHDLWLKTPPYRITKVRYSRAVDPAYTTPYLEAIVHEGRLAVVYSKYDLSCALERHPTFGCRGYSAQDAFRVASNVVMYALTQ